MIMLSCWWFDVELRVSCRGDVNDDGDADKEVFIALAVRTISVLLFLWGAFMGGENPDGGNRDDDDDDEGTTIFVIKDMLLLDTNDWFDCSELLALFKFKLCNMIDGRVLLG